MVRLFAALPLPEETRHVLSSLQKPRLPFARWTDPAQLHLTLCFLGDVNESYLDSIGQRLEKLSKTQDAFAMSVQSLRFHAPAMVWAECQRSDVFDRLYQAAHIEMAKVAAELVWIAEEMRAPRPHITMARLSRGAGRLDPAPLAAPISFTVDRIELMQSTLQSGGPIYETLQSFPLTNHV